MYCSQCGKELADNVRFCPDCGAQTLLNNAISHQPSTHRNNQQISKLIKLFIGIASVLPLLYMIFFMGTFFSMAFLHRTLIPFNVLFGIHMFTIFYIFGLLVFYIYNLFKNENVKSDQKVLWALVLFMGNMMAMPIYWYLYIWRESGDRNII
jgi:hypothetical protein